MVTMLEIHRVSGERATLPAIDAKRAVREHPQEWSREPWPAGEVTRALAGKSEDHLAALMADRQRSELREELRRAQEVHGRALDRIYGSVGGRARRRNRASARTARGIGCCNGKDTAPEPHRVEDRKEKFRKRTAPRQRHGASNQTHDAPCREEVMAYLTSLDEITTILDTDFLYVCRPGDPSSPDKKIAFANLRPAGTRIQQFLSLDDTVTIPDLAAGAGNTWTFTLTGAREGDFILVNFTEGLPIGLGVMAVRVSADDTVELRMRNFAGADFEHEAVPLNALLIRT